MPKTLALDRLSPVKDAEAELLLSVKNENPEFFNEICPDELMEVEPEEEDWVTQALEDKNAYPSERGKGRQNEKAFGRSKKFEFNFGQILVKKIVDDKVLSLKKREGVIK